jgi:tripartite-type tricarboxylate transporter receptor subunit TctC
MLGRPAIVINRIGASGNIGTQSVVRAKADGHTLLLTGVGVVVSPLLHAQPGYDLQRDLVPVARLAEAPNVLLVHESVRKLGLSGLLDNSSVLAYASAGYGHSSHLASELLQSRTGARWLHVPFKGTASGARALMAGTVQMMFAPAGSVQTMLAQGKVHAVAVAHPKRLNFLTTTPTLAELGVKDANFSQWYGLFAPAGTPGQVLSLLNEALTKVTSDPDFQADLGVNGVQPAWMNRAEFSDFVQMEHKRLSQLAKRIGVERAGD